MNELFLAETPETAGALDVATIGSVSNSGITLVINGHTTEKKYKRLLNGQTLSAGDRVLVAKISGTYVVLGKIAYS